MQIKPYSPIGLLILLETMLLYACTADEWISHPENDMVQLSAAITPLSGSTRAHVGDKGNESFQVDDKITLFVTPQGEFSSGTLGRTMRLTTEGWSPKLAWQEIAGEQVTFTAFYPENVRL